MVTICWIGREVVTTSTLLLKMVVEVIDVVEAVTGIEDGSGGGAEELGDRVESSQAVIQPS